MYLNVINKMSIKLYLKPIAYKPRFSSIKEMFDVLKKFQSQTGSKKKNLRKYEFEFSYSFV